MTTFATINIDTGAIDFHASADAASAYGDANDLLVVTEKADLDASSGPQLVNLFNAISAELGPDYSPVKRFADKESAAVRTWIRLQDLAQKRAKERPAPAPAKAPAADTITVTYRSVDGHTDTRKFKTVAGAARFAVERVGQHPEMGRDYAASGDGIGTVRVSGATLAELFAPRPAPAPATPREDREIWRRVKREEPEKVAYRPVPGSVQAGLYDLLTTEGGMTMEDYCAKAAQLNTRDKTLFTPPQVWGALRYLFVTKRGYGLDFDGQRIRLLVPADERSVPAKGA